MTDKATATHTRTKLAGAVLGQTEVTKTIDDGLFICPKATTERAYWHRRVRSWTTVFSVRLIPTRTVGEFVECFSCGATVDPRILTSTHPSLRPIHQQI